MLSKDAREARPTGRASNHQITLRQLDSRQCNKNVYTEPLPFFSYPQPYEVVFDCGFAVYSDVLCAEYY